MECKQQFRNLPLNLIARAAAAALAIAFVFALTVVLTPSARAQTPTASIAWNEKVLYSFGRGRDDGGYPYASLISDAAGNFHGTTYFGGANGWGTVFELTPTAGGGWTEDVLYNFNGGDGRWPEAGLIFDAAGNLYGTTSGGGTYGDYGTVFELLTPEWGGGWTEQVLHSFGNGADGTYPQAGLIFDTAGNLYGTTQQGGAYYNYGTVFELTPARPFATM
jgi:uncharacterized repeat protein (TIGR03803 family)